MPAFYEFDPLARTPSRACEKPIDSRLSRLSVGYLVSTQVAFLLVSGGWGDRLWWTAERRTSGEEVVFSVRTEWTGSTSMRHDVISPLPPSLAPLSFTSQPLIPDILEPPSALSVVSPGHSLSFDLHASFPVSIKGWLMTIVCFDPGRANEEQCLEPPETFKRLWVA